jgi:hypothetical protein
MPPIARVAETLHLSVVGLWLGALLMTAAVAAVIFPTMRELDPTFGLFRAYGGPQADLGAGYIQARVFFVADVVQFVGAFAGGVTLAVSIAARRNLRSRLTMARSVLFGAAVLVFAFEFFVLSPRMNRNATAYWRAAEAGDVVAAEKSRQMFSADHPTATRTFGATAVLVLGSLVAAGWSATGGAGRAAGRDPATKGGN